MKQYDVYSFEQGTFPYVLNMQSHLLDTYNTTVVIPLWYEKDINNEHEKRLKPLIHINDCNLIMNTTDIAAVPVSLLGHKITNIKSEYRYTITNALDFLFSGF